jgi:hypothetical protein
MDEEHAHGEEQGQHVVQWSGTVIRERIRGASR